MADIAKWAILVAGLVAIIALIVALPIFELLDIAVLTSAIGNIANLAGAALTSARGLLNYFVLPAAIPLVTVVIGYVILRPFLLWSIKILTMAYHWIFK